jgi:hypothetical protein
MSEPEWIHEEYEPKPATKKQKLILNISLGLALPFCIWAGWFELSRAQTGNWRAWVYTFEWPFFGGVCIYLWNRLRKGDIPKIPKLNLPYTITDENEADK